MPNSPVGRPSLCVDISKRTDKDVIFGKGNLPDGKRIAEHPGNVKYREMVSESVGEYFHEDVSKRKVVVASIMKKILDEGGRFIVKSNESNYRILSNDKTIYQKVQKRFYDQHREVPHSSKPEVTVAPTAPLMTRDSLMAKLSTKTTAPRPIQRNHKAPLRAAAADDNFLANLASTRIQMKTTGENELSNQIQYSSANDTTIFGLILLPHLQEQLASRDNRNRPSSEGRVNKENMNGVNCKTSNDNTELHLEQKFQRQQEQLERQQEQLERQQHEIECLKGQNELLKEKLSNQEENQRRQQEQLRLLQVQFTVHQEHLRIQEKKIKQYARKESIPP